MASVSKIKVIWVCMGGFSKLEGPKEKQIILSSCLVLHGMFCFEGPGFEETPRGDSCGNWSSTLWFYSTHICLEGKMGLLPCFCGRSVLEVLTRATLPRYSRGVGVIWFPGKAPGGSKKDGLPT